MKKISVLLVILLCLTCLCSCLPTDLVIYEDYEHMKTIVESIELIYYHNDSAKRIYLSYLISWKYQSFDFTKMTVIDTLSSDKLDDFLEGLSKVTVYDETYTDSPNKEGIKINYTDGSFDIVCFLSYSAAFDSNGNFIKTLGGGGSDKLIELVNAYFGTEFELYQ